MSIRLPESMDEVIYFTNRKIGSGSAKAWAFRIKCPECGKGTMGKPVEKGKIKIRADHYVCPECGHKEEKREHEAKLTLSVIYTCPHCGREGEAETGYKRKTFEGVQAQVFDCEFCGQKIGITKKMKKPKKK